MTRPNPWSPSSNVNFQPKSQEKTEAEDEESNGEDGEDKSVEKPIGMTTSVSANFNQLNPDIVHALFKNSKE